MVSRKALCALTAIMSFALPIAARAQGDYVDVLTVKVKPEKLADFQALTKRYADANRRFNGDRWIVLETEYGEANVYQFTSSRQDYADIGKAAIAEQAADNKAFGKDTDKLAQDFANCLVWSRSELRHRRWDLNRKAPADAQAYAKLVGESRLLRTTSVHIRPGHVPDFEALMKEAKEAGEKNPATAPVFISQAIEGGKGATFYVSTLRSSLAGFDHNPTPKEVLGEEGYKKLQQMAADSYEGTESTLFRFNPELSNPPEAVVEVAPDFWRPKAKAASAPKPKPTPAPTPKPN